MHPAKNDHYRLNPAQLRALCAVLGEENAGFSRLRTLRVRKDLRKVHAKGWTTRAPALRLPSERVGALSHAGARQRCQMVSSTATRDRRTGLKMGGQAVGVMPRTRNPFQTCLVLPMTCVHATLTVTHSVGASAGCARAGCG